jgi:soluble lytic murein transglycosylase-like protein
MVRTGSIQGRLCILLTLAFLLAAGQRSAVSATLYLCRDRSGSWSYTNVPNSNECKVHNLKKTRDTFAGYSPWAGNTDSSKFDHEIHRVGKLYDVDPPLIKAIIHIESDFNPKAVSKKGAQGLMQLMPDTARELQVDDPFDPKDNIEGGVRYFKQILDLFEGNLLLSLAAYNAGPGLVRRTGGVPRIPETRRYVNKVLKRYKFYKAKR